MTAEDSVGTGDLDAGFESEFFEEPTLSVDGTTTSAGHLWHAAPPRWGHSMHSMCSYHGMFPPRLAHYFIQTYTSPGDLVVDPFGGRGTTALQARVEGRRVASNDLNPLAYVLTSAKVAPPQWESVMHAVDEIEKGMTSRVCDDLSQSVPDEIRMLYHPKTLGQLAYLRSRLLSKSLTDWTPEEFMIGGAIAGILHGGARRDGSSQYLSISMPNTFSMSPRYVRRYIHDNGLVPPEQDVFERLRDKLARLYLDDPTGLDGGSYMNDAAAFLEGEIAPGSVDLILTSPPYLQVVNYGQANWIRLWWLGVDGVAHHNGTGRQMLDARLDHGHGYDSYREFILRVLRCCRSVLSDRGVAVFVIGDVAQPGQPAIPLAERVWNDIGHKSGLRCVEIIEDYLVPESKVSRIWGDTRGRATECERLLVLTRDDANHEVQPKAVDWDEPYKDAGPDAAHARLRKL